MATQAEEARQHHRDREGKYAKVFPCDLCGKSAGQGYYSWEHCNEQGYGVQLCGKCAPKLEGLPEAEALALLKAAEKHSPILPKTMVE
jgi:hypothetical protein